MSVGVWRYKRDHIVNVLNHLPDGDEFIVFVHGKMLAMARNEVYLLCAKKLVGSLAESLSAIPEEKPHYKDFVDGLNAVVAGIDKAHADLLKADEVNVKVGPDAIA